MQQIKAKIISNKNIKENYFLLELDAKKIARQALPGQFVHVRVASVSAPLLRRPISIHSVDKNLKLLYEVKGKGTEVLSHRKPREMLDIIGPLGNGFKIPDARCLILVAGGMGIAPLYFLAQKLKQIADDRLQIIVLIGSKTKNKVMGVSEFKKLGCKVEIATEDGSLGKKGLVTDSLKKELSTVNSQQSTVYSCGPKPMLAAVAKVVAKKKIPTQVSLEEFMGCGIGACLGCVIKTKDGQKRVCKDGPVFDAQDIEF